MNKKSICSMIAALLIALMATMILPASAWSYGDPAKVDDELYEKFGPRADRLLIKLYSSPYQEWDTGLETGQIDVTDWPLDETHYNRYTAPPWDATVKVCGYGAEYGICLFDLNNNNNQYLGNPPDPMYPNPVYPNPMSDIDLRKAVAYLSNRAAYVAFIGATTSIPVYTPVPDAYGKYSHTGIRPGGENEALCYLYNPAAANATLETGGFPTNPATGWRYWDRDSDFVQDLNEAFSLKIVARADDPNRGFAGGTLRADLNGCGVPNTIIYVTSGAARTQVMYNKDFHIYTGCWSLPVDPDYLIIWNWDFYWHPGNCYNYDGCNDAAFNDASYGVMYANDQAEAVSYAQSAQEAYATAVLSVPLWEYNGYKAVKRAYTGTPGVTDVEDIYEGKYWEGFVNVPGYGVDSYWSFLNMHPEGYEFGSDQGGIDGSNMTIRYGQVGQELPSLNPIYASSRSETNVLDLIYECGFDLLHREPYHQDQMTPWGALRYSVGTYNHPLYGTCSKVVFTLRPGEWSDSTPITLADIYFTLVEIDDILRGRGLPPPWWYSNVRGILSFSQLDALNFEVLLDVKSIFAVSWVGENVILPKHIWKPLCTTGDPTTFAPDPNLIGSAAWRLVEYVENSHVLLTANSPEKTVANNLAGSVPVTSDQGYFRWTPIVAEIARADYQYKLPLDVGAVDVKLVNAMQEDIPGVNGIIHIIYPNGTVQDIAFGPATVPADSAWTISLPALTGYGKFRTHVDVWWDCNYGGITQLCPITLTWYKWHWCRMVFWSTIDEDIAGSTWYDDVGLGTYLYKSELVTPDFKVDIKDCARAAGAFGSYPGHAKWSTICDVNGDYKIDIKDLARISGKFGWHA